MTDSTRKMRMICLYRIGLDLDGPAIGAMVGDFIRNCWSDGIVPVIDCSYLRRIGPEFVDGFIESMVRPHFDGISEGVVRLAHSSEEIRGRFESAFRTLREVPAPAPRHH